MYRLPRRRPALEAATLSDGGTDEAGVPCQSVFCFVWGRYPRWVTDDDLLAALAHGPRLSFGDGSVSNVPSARFSKARRVISTEAPGVGG